jgi:FtsP/CotA-like multicopper oxidase with cupredoxin domain
VRRVRPCLIVLLGSLSALPVLAAEPASGTPQLAALDVSQPDGWDRDVGLKPAPDLNPDPDILEVNIEAKIADVEIKPGTVVKAWTYNGLLPGPFLKAKVGDRLIVHFKNSLPEATTVHWHGVRVPNNMDGTPNMSQAPVEPGGEFLYDFVLKDAGTYWYHPHMDSPAQVGRGLYAPIVVEDPNDPKEFGDDLVLVLSDMSLDEKGVLQPKDNGGSFGDLFGREGNILLVNGKVMPRLKVRSGKQQRWRIINSARSRYWSFAMRNNTFVRIGGDNGLMERSEKLTRLTITPAERLDVVYTPGLAPGSVSTLRWLPVDRGYGTAFARLSEDIMTIETVADAPVRPAVIPEKLREIKPIDLSRVVEHTLELTIKLDRGIVEMGINGIPNWQAKPLAARIGEKHIWTLVNNSPFDHPFHLHGYFFQVLDDKRVPEWKDTVNVPVNSTVRIAVDFDERPGMWMYHCHILDHAEVGMMGHLHVVDPAAPASGGKDAPHAAH